MKKIFHVTGIDFTADTDHANMDFGFFSTLEKAEKAAEKAVAGLGGFRWVAAPSFALCGCTALEYYTTVDGEDEMEDIRLMIDVIPVDEEV